MSKKQQTTEVLIDEAEKALREMLKEVTGKIKVRDDGAPAEVFTLTDKMKVLDRVIKLAAIKAKLKDDEYGTGFYTTNDDKEE
jgi:hypothetical protein